MMDAADFVVFWQLSTSVEEVVRCFKRMGVETTPKKIRSRARRYIDAGVNLRPMNGHKTPHTYRFTRTEVQAYNSHILMSV